MTTKEKDFFDFIFERQLVWYNRNVKCTKSWTTDETLQKYKFCNCYRELDKGTQYIINKLKTEKSREIIFQNIVFYRFFNKFNLYEDLDISTIKEWNKETTKELIKRFDYLRSQGKTIFNDAYLISGNKTKEPKHVFILKQLEYSFSDNKVKELIKEIDNCKTPKESMQVIKKIPKVGDFLAYEIWTDLTYFNFFNQKWTDNDVVNIGPGAKWGLELIYEKKLSNKEQLEKINHLHKVQKQFLEKIKKNKLSWKDINYNDCFTNVPYLSLRNIEHSLCEFRKYLRLKEGKGKKRYFKK
jgi:hypothetical protein